MVNRSLLFVPPNKYWFCFEFDDYIEHFFGLASLKGAISFLAFFDIFYCIMLAYQFPIDPALFDIITIGFMFIGFTPSIYGLIGIMKEQINYCIPFYYWRLLCTLVITVFEIYTKMNDCFYGQCGNWILLKCLYIIFYIIIEFYFSIITFSWIKCTQRNIEMFETFRLSLTFENKNESQGEWINKI